MAMKETETTTSMDLFEILTKPVLEMSDEELLTAVSMIREQRKVRVSGARVKSGLEILLSKLSPANARVILQQLNPGGKKEEK